MTKIISAFCGAGKTYLCQNSEEKLLEFECWQYCDKPDFPNNIVEEVLLAYGDADIIFISTNPIVLDGLMDKGMNITIVCPDISLKDEYIGRYIKRGSSKDFICTLSKYWEQWITEAVSRKKCQHIVLTSGQYIEDVL